MRNFVFFSLILLSLNVIAQEKIQRKIYYQINFGTTVSIPYKNKIETLTNFPNHPIFEYQSWYGYIIEGKIGYNLTSNSTINCGINYKRISYGINYKEGIFERNGKLFTDYISIPLLTKFKSDKMPISLGLGLYAGWIISAKEQGVIKTDISQIIVNDPNDPVLLNIKTEQDFNRNTKDDYKDIDFGLIIHIDYEIKLNNNLSCMIFSKFNYGLTNILVDKIEYDWKNRNILIGIGLKL